MHTTIRISMAAAVLTLFAASAAFAGVPWIAHQITVEIAGPTLDPSLQYELAIGATAFIVNPGRRDGAGRTVGDGNATVKTDESQAVTLRAIPGCALITSFTGQSGHLYSIRLDTPTHAIVSKAFGVDSTPLNAESSARCTLPPTDATATGPAHGSLLPSVAVLPLAGVVGLIAAFGLRRRRAR